METHPSAGLAVNSGRVGPTVQKLSPGILCHWHCPVPLVPFVPGPMSAPLPESQQGISEPGTREQQGCLCVCVCVLLCM